MRRIIFIFFIMIILFSHINCYSDERFSYNNLLYKDIIGKISIPNTNINNYVLQTKDNFYYLNHSYNNSEDKFGSIFLDFRNNLNDKVLLIYGHNSKYNDQALFKDLEKYKDEKFYKNNKYIYLTLGDDKYKYLIFSVNVVNNTDIYHTRIDYSEMDFFRYFLDVKSKSLYETKVNISQDDYVITLQTCNYDPANTYLLINARRI